MKNKNIQEAFQNLNTAEENMTNMTPLALKEQLEKLKEEADAGIIFFIK